MKQKSPLAIIVILGILAAGVTFAADRSRVKIARDLHGRLGATAAETQMRVIVTYAAEATESDVRRIGRSVGLSGERQSRS